MHANKRLSIAALMALGGIPAFACPALAAPAETIHSSGCYEVIDDEGNVFEICSTQHYVFVETTSASGVTVVKTTGRFEEVVRVNGVVASEVSQTGSAINVTIDGGEPQVAHDSTRSSFTVANGVCSAKNNYTFANGAFRHDVSDFECTT